MRLTILTRPGEKHGPCEQCRHDQCAEQRELASTVCHCCQDLIGFHRAFCFDADRRPVHFACLSIEIERHARLLGIEAESVTTPTAPLLYDKPAAAKLLNISESTISELMNAGELSRVKIGVRVLFTPKMLTDLITRKTILATPDRLRAVS